MRLNIHDFSGHPFQVELSRELASRGHSVVHGYSSQYVTGHGRLDLAESDPATLRIEPLDTHRPLVKYSPRGRLRFELSYAEAWRAMLERDPADVVVACNVPLFALDRMKRYFDQRRQPWILWHQDLHSLGVGAEAVRKLPAALAALACERLQRLERLQVEAASAVVAITDAMVDQYRAWGVKRKDVAVIPNWAPLGDIQPRERNNSWAGEHGLPRDAVRLMYAGTLGRKHNPLLLLDLLDAARARGVDAMLVVASEGVGAEALKVAAYGRTDIRFVPYQPADRLADMLATADVVLTLLEHDAARFSVPSKVLTYLAAGRPVVALVPQDNPAAIDVARAGGFVAVPTPQGAADAAAWLASTSADQNRLRDIGHRSRQLAERMFDVGAKADAFELLLRQVADAYPDARERRASSKRERRTGDFAGATPI